MTNATSVDSPRAEVLRYVTEHYRDLQGLSQVPAWLAFTVLSMYDFGKHRSVAYSLGALAAAGGFGVAGLLLGSRWYASRYGRITPQERTLGSPVLSILPAKQEAAASQRSYSMTAGAAGVAGLACILLEYLPVLFRRFDGHGRPSPALFTVVLLLPIAGSGVPPDSLVRLRRALYQFVTFLLCALYCDHLFAGISAAACIAVACASMCALKLYDHWLLDHLLSPRFQDNI